VKLGVMIKEFPPGNVLFKEQCEDIFNKRWGQFNFDLYLLAFFLHPQHRGMYLFPCHFIKRLNINIIKYNYVDKGLHMNTFCIICEKSLQIWKNLGGGNTSANELIAQLSNYSLKTKPYDFEFVPGIHPVNSWWLMCKQKNNHIQCLALMIHSITPHNTSCERIFSVLGTKDEQGKSIIILNS